MDIALDEVIYFDCVTHHPSTGAVTDADSTPTFEVFEESTDTDIGVGGNLTKRTSKTGNYRGSFTLSSANGFEIGKWYNVIASATVNSIAGKAKVERFRVCAAEATAGYPKVDQQLLQGDSQSATDLKDFADAGYDPSTNKVQGVVLTDTCTTNTDMRGTDSAATAAEMAKVPKSDGSVTWNATALASINAQADTALADYDGPTYTELLNFIRVMCRSDSAIATDLLSVIGAINADLASGAGDFTPVADSHEAVADAIADVPNNSEFNARTLASADYGTAANQATIAGYLDTEIAAIKAKTDNLPSDPADQSAVEGAITTAQGVVTAAIAALNNLSSAQAQTAAAAALTAYDPPTKAELDTAVDALPTAAENAAAILAAGDVDGFSLEETLKLCLSALAAKLSGAATTTIVIRAADDSKNRITATVDADGNRSAVTLDAT